MSIGSRNHTYSGSEVRPDNGARDSLKAFMVKKRSSLRTECRRKSLWRQCNHDNLCAKAYNFSLVVDKSNNAALCADEREMRSPSLETGTPSVTPINMCRLDTASVVTPAQLHLGLLSKPKLDYLTIPPLAPVAATFLQIPPLFFRSPLVSYSFADFPPSFTPLADIMPRSASE